MSLLGEKKSLNYSYLGVTIILLMICYYFLYSTKKGIYHKKLSDDIINRKIITVKTSNGDIMLDPNIFEMHMKRFKDNITELNDKISNETCESLKHIIKDTNKNIKAYIQLNTEDIADFCNEDNLIDESILKERDALKAKILKTARMENNINDEDKTRLLLLETILDIDIIIFLIKSSLCKKGKLDLSAIDMLILELYRNKCINCNKQPDIFETEKLTVKSFDIPVNTSNKTINSISIKPIRLDGSQKISEKFIDNPLKKIFKPTDNKERMNNFISHQYGNEYTNPDNKESVNKNYNGFNYRNAFSVNDITNYRTSLLNTFE
jgi:hypothetical protein